MQGRVYGFLLGEVDASIAEMKVTLKLSEDQIRGAIDRLRRDHGFNIQNVGHGSMRFKLVRSGVRSK